MALIPVPEKDTVAVATRPKFAVIGREEVVEVRKAAKYIPVIPTGNGCCPGICKNINDEIDKLGRDLEKRKKSYRSLPQGKSKLR